MSDRLYKSLWVALVAATAALMALPLVRAAGGAAATQTRAQTGVVKYDVGWQSNASGIVSGNPISLRGLLVQVEFIPGAGAAQPTASYGVTLVDAAGADYLNGAGASLSNSVAKVTPIGPPAYVDGQVDVAVAAAGASKRGRVVLWVQVE